MGDFEQSGIELILDSSQYERNLRRVLIDADKLDGVLDGIIQSADAVGRAINDIDGSVNMDVSVDEADIETALDIAANLDTNRAFTVNADEADIETALDIAANLDTNRAFTVNADEADIETAVRLARDLDVNRAFTVSADESDIETAVRLARDLDTNRAFTVNADEADIETAVRLARDLDTNRAFTVNADEADIETALDIAANLDENHAFTVSVDESDIDAAIDVAAELDENHAFDVTADTSRAESDLSALSGQIEALRSIASIDLALNLAGSAMSALSMLQDPTSLPLVGSIFEMDTAMAQLEGTTGRMIPQAETLIRDLYTNAWGESRTEIAGVIEQAALLGIATGDIESAVRAAFNIQDTGIAETDEALRTMQTMVRNELVPDFQAASDIIVAGFQTGANRGDDLLDTLNEYGSTFGQLRISGEAALALINSGLEAGIDNSDRIADAIRETGIRLGEIGTNPAVAEAFARLDSMSEIDLSASLDAFTSGEMTGDEFFAGFFAALDEAAASDQTAASEIAATLVGTIAEDFGVEAVAQLTPAWDDTMGIIEGRAQAASDTINSTLGTAITSLSRTIEEEVAVTLNDAFDIDQMIEDVQAAIGEIGAAIREGRSIGEAIEIGFSLEDSPIRRIESMLNAVALGFLDAIAGVLDLVGRGDLAGQLREQITEFAGGQVAFDLQIATSAEEVTGTVSRALARGVDEADIGTALQQAIDERLAAGDIAGAQAIADGVSGAVAEGLQNVDGAAFAQRIYTTMTSFGGDVDALTAALGVDSLQEATTEALAGAVASLAAETDNADLASQLSGELTNFSVDAAAALASIDMSGLNEQIDTAMATATGQLEQLRGSAEEAFMAGDFDAAATQLTDAIVLAQSVGDEVMVATLETTLAFVEDMQASADAADTAGDEIDTALTESEAAVAEFDANTGTALANAAAHFSTYQGAALAAMAAVNGEIANTAAALATLNGGLEAAGIEPADLAAQQRAVNERAAGGPLTGGATLVGEQGPELLTSDASAGFVINAANTNAILQALATGLTGGGGGATTINMTNNIYTNNQAAAEAFGLRTARAVRGFA